MKIPAILISLCLANLAFAAETTLTDTQGKTAWLYTPTDQPEEGKTYWLAVGAHGAGVDGKGACGIASWAGEDVIVLGPSFVEPPRDPAAPKTEGMPPTSYQMAGPVHVDKLKALIAEVGKKWRLHPKVFVHGFSAGAQFAHRFAMKEPDLVAGMSAASAGAWATTGFGEINPKASTIPFAISCGEHDRAKSWPTAPMNRVEWLKSFAADLGKANFDVESRVIEGTGHQQNENTLALARSCFERARGLNFSRTALLALDFNGVNPLWNLTAKAVEAGSGQSVTAAATWDAGGGVVEERGTSVHSGAIRLTVNSGPATPEWSGRLETGLLPMTRTEPDLKMLTLSFDLVASIARPVSVKVESFDSSKRRTGGLAGQVIPAAPDFYHRHTLDLGAMTASGDGSFQADAPYLQVTFTIGSDLGWPAAAGNQVRVDNLSYTAPALFVSPAGNDVSNDGQRADRPLATVQKAVDRARAGDVIMVMDGTYTSERSVANIRDGGEPAAWLVLRAHPGHRPVFRSAWWDTVFIGQGYKEAPSAAPATAYVEVRGLTILGYSPEVEAKYRDKIGKSEPETNTNGISCSGRYQTNRPHHLRIADCVISDCPGGGIAVIAADRISIENNHVHDNCKWMIFAGSGISKLHGSNFEDSPLEYRVLIRNNRCHDNLCTQPWNATGKLSDGNGIIVDDMRNTQEPSPTGIYHGRVLVQGNVSYLNGGSGMHSFSSNHVDFVNNTTYGNNRVMDYAQISITQCSDCRMLNNIIVAPADKAINRVNGNSNDIVISHNLYWGGNGPPMASESPVIADPLFVDAAKGDFQLKPGSPALGKGGFWEGLPTSYQDGSCRPVTRPPDIGALPPVP